MYRQDGHESASVKPVTMQEKDSHYGEYACK